MPCYHPFAGFPDYSGFTENGKRKYKIVGRWLPDSKIIDPNVVRIPCGKCIGCRLDYSRSWADRMMLELDHTGKAIFVTLTYNNEHLPFTENEDTGELGFCSLYKRDLQLFFKRLRRKYPDRTLRYYAAGEYGSTTYRPHYHAIIFGIGLEDFSKKDIVFLKKNQLGDPIYSVRPIAEAWSIYDKKTNSYDPIGFVCVANVSWKTCAYVARYVQKKIMHEYNCLEELYGIEPEFSLVSRKPGLGSFYLDDHPDALDFSILHPAGCKEDIYIPKYFIEKLNNENSTCFDPDRYDKIRSERKKYADDALLLKLTKTDLPYIEMLENEENIKLSKCKSLKRDMSF